MPRFRRIGAVWGVLLFSTTFGHAGEVENANIFLDDGADYSEASELQMSARTASRTKLFERKRNECLGLLLSISRKCKRTVRRKAQNDQCTTENECQDLYSTCHDRLRRHFIRERSCQRVTRGRVPLCEAETRFIAVQNNPQEPKFDERQLRNITDPDLLANSETPQGQAFNWIAREDELELDANNVTLEQRYILATLFFATNGDGWDSCYRGAPERNCRPIVGRPGMPQASPASSLIRMYGNSIFCLGVNTGENVVLRECNMADDRMLWDLSDDGFLILRARSDRLDPSGLCAGATNRNNNQVVELFECDPSLENRRWRFNASGGFDFSLSDSNVCMTTEDGNDLELGDAITITQCDGNIDQRWDYDGETLTTSTIVPSFLSPLHECEWFGITSCLNGSHVENISLRRNNLIGFLPGELRHLSYLERLGLSSNHLAGQINPQSLPRSLSVLELGENSLIGDIPRLDLPFLKQLDISDNKFSGGLDVLFQSLPRKISLVRLNNNRLTEEVPGILSKFISLSELTILMKLGPCNECYLILEFLYF